jgi:DDE superfamily endonuclease
VVALACELPAQRAQPLSRSSIGELVRLISADPAAPPLSRSTIWRILDRHVLKPWRYRSWLFPRDPEFAAKAGRVLDLYAGFWEGAPLGPADCVLSADEKTSIQARGRRHPSAPPGPGEGQRIEHEYARGGALAYLAAWDVRAGGVIGRCEAATGKAAFDRLVDQVMTAEPYRSARRVFWIVDNGSSHRGEPAATALTQRYPTLILVHLPLHASWLNQIEIYFSILQRKALDAERLRRSRRGRGAPTGVRGAVQRHRGPLRLAFHAGRPRGALGRPAHRSAHRHSAPGGRLT